MQQVCYGTPQMLYPSEAANFGEVAAGGPPCGDAAAEKPKAEAAEDATALHGAPPGLGGGSDAPQQVIARLRGGGEEGCLFLFTGEGAHDAQTDVASLRASPAWPVLEATMQRLRGIGLADFLASHLGEHAAPGSPLVTTIINLLNADRWRAAGHVPRLALGHSIGEVAAAHAAGMLSVEQAVATARTLGLVGCQKTGAMVHARLTPDVVDAWPDEELRVAAVNGALQADASASPLLSATLCGPSEPAEAWLSAHPEAKRLMPPHPWHHPMYLDVPGVRDGSALASLPVSSTPGSATVFVSAIRPEASTEQPLDAAYWCKWLTTRVNFKGALERAAALPTGGSCYLIETGAHATLLLTSAKTLTESGVRVLASTESMRRGQPAGFFETQCSRLRALLDDAHTMSAAAHGEPAAADLMAAATRLQGLLKESCGLSIGLDVPLMQSGLTSKLLPRFVDELNTSFDTHQPVTLVLECPTLRAIVTRLLTGGRLPAMLTRHKNSDQAVRARAPCRPRPACPVPRCGCLLCTTLRLPALYRAAAACSVPRRGWLPCTAPRLPALYRAATPCPVLHLMHAPYTTSRVRRWHCVAASGAGQARHGQHRSMHSCPRVATPFWRSQLRAGSLQSSRQSVLAVTYMVPSASMESGSV